MGSGRNGVEVRETSIRLFFVWQGKRCRETLTVGGRPLGPTPANRKYAERVAAEIRDKIRIGTFNLADYFPDSPRAGQAGAMETVLADMCATWLKTKGRLATKTQNQYRNALDVWMELLGGQTPMAKLTHGVIAAKVGSHPWASAKLLNNYLIPLRGVFKLAGRELDLDDPMEGIENSRHQQAVPDPLSPSEMESILRAMTKECDPRITAYFEFAFLTGLRPEELIELRWSDIDWNHETARVQRARTAGEVKALKTYAVRDVDLVGRAVQALQRMKPWTFVAGEEIFQNPVTNRAFHDERSQRDHYWKPVLRRLGIRARRAYQTRHTYATNALSAGVNPSYVARQMGHANAKMLFTVYAKWIDGADRGREKAKMEAMLELGQRKTG
ncbi:site-specific integrase [Xylophilus sp. GOD-11R]|uniref:site-specific integrase n=1 Tax=Xylophilus sp. GOD-11R TaxID=3089814 RepID=UPI00298C39F6|nr:site-specific integrase [Xylophilus sp. GOD-11R]WPB58597.1 site-specific integrase [Xylophilus sp. GOD-11R]